MLGKCLHDLAPKIDSTVAELINFLCALFPLVPLTLQRKGEARKYLSFCLIYIFQRMTLSYEILIR